MGRDIVPAEIRHRTRLKREIMGNDTDEPISRIYSSGRLTLHLAEWGQENSETVVLVHGYRDHCRSWDAMARVLRSGYRVIAPDLRGHGNSQWVVGGTYALDDFVYDLHCLLQEQTANPVSIVAHSMGAAVSLNFAGLFPNRVKALVAIEGTWQLERAEPVYGPDETQKRLTHWIDQIDSLTAAGHRTYASIGEAEARLKAEHPRLDSALVRHLTAHGVKRNPDGSVNWKYDPLLKARAPSRFGRDATIDLWSRIACPVTLVHGSESKMGDARALGLDRHFRQGNAVDIADAGHWVHHDQPEKFAALMLKALRR